MAEFDVCIVVRVPIQAESYDQAIDRAIPIRNNVESALLIQGGSVDALPFVVNRGSPLSLKIRTPRTNGAEKHLEFVRKFFPSVASNEVLMEQLEEQLRQDPHVSLQALLQVGSLEKSIDPAIRETNGGKNDPNQDWAQVHAFMGVVGMFLKKNQGVDDPTALETGLRARFDEVFSPRFLKNVSVRAMGRTVIVARYTASDPDLPPFELVKTVAEYMAAADGF